MIVAMMAQLFTVRGALGEFLGTYRRMTAAQALQAFKDDQVAHFSTFRTRTPPNFQGVTAKVEG